MPEYSDIANLKGPKGDPGEPGIGTRGSLVEVTNIDAMRGVEDIGHYMIRASNMVGGPDVEGDPLCHLEVLRGSGNGILHRITTSTQVWWRTAASASSWASWRREDAGANGALLAATDIDAFKEQHHIGHYVGRAEDMVGGPPIDGNRVCHLEVKRGADNGVLHRVTTSEEIWWRTSASATSWAPWRRVGEQDSDPTAGISYDDDGTPYLADGAGSNPQPASRRLVTEESLTDLNSGHTTSPTVRRIITSTDPDEPLQDGDLLLIYSD